MRRFASIVGLALLGGCASIGPQRLGIDRSDYADHLRETNKEQLLLNIVALRYGDAPLFLEVSSVIAQYTREGSLNARLSIEPHSGADDAGGVGGNVLIRETPTVTYTPLSGDRFVRSLLGPISPASLLGMIASGWSPDVLFRLAARSINGIDSGSRDPLFTQAADPQFDQVLAALGRLQLSRALALQVVRDEGSQYTASGTIAVALTEQDRADLAYLRSVLKLPGDGAKLKIVFAQAPTQPDELAIGTRSMFEIFAVMSQGVEVPAMDRTQAMPVASHQASRPALIHIHSGAQRPSDAHVAVRYRGSWFWIDGSDAQSKRMFLVAQILLSLNDTSGKVDAPLVTIPAG